MIDQFIGGLETYLGASMVFSYIAVYMGGVLASFTPCVYPVIPITVAYIASQSSGKKTRGFVLSIFYVLGTSVTYTILGSIATFTGHLFGQIQSSPWTYLVVANICILMGLSMLDVFTLALPQFLTRSRSTGRKGLAGSFVLGALSGLILGPCTAPILGVLLGYVATKQHMAYGMSLLFVFAFGMGTLLIILGTFTGLLTSIPKAGMWMVRVQKAFGWGMIALGEYFLIIAGQNMI
ncbi:MAG: sulfite exporter TauE/SafE family protein [Deltaproteobacteria bacterium]|nr:sulfite exporter TauE/SafE family protein [Deltaproteobacteria bacterium]